MYFYHYKEDFSIIICEWGNLSMKYVIVKYILLNIY